MIKRARVGLALALCFALGARGEAAGKAGLRGNGTGTVDLVFLIDNSGSMWSDHAYIDGNDTEFYHAPSDTRTTSGALSYAVRDDLWNRMPSLLIRTVLLYPDKPPSGTLFAGDPFNLRGALVKNAIDYIAGISPNSTLGVVGFGSDTMHTQPHWRRMRP